jgi:hypothetical protein
MKCVLYALPSRLAIRMIKSRRMRGVGHRTQMGRRATYIYVIGKTTRRDKT